MQIWKRKLKEQDGILSENKYTEYSRAVLALCAIGEDPSEIGGYDIQKPLEDYETVVSQGLNGAVFCPPCPECTGSAGE